MNAAIVTLLASIDWQRSVFPNYLVREDGSRLDADEVEMVGQATIAELEAAADHFRTLQDFALTQMRHAQRLVELAEPYYAMPGVETMADVEALMTDAERAELAVIAAAIAPDGNLVIST